MARKVDQDEGHYNVREVKHSTVYMWSPESVEVACDCGERVTITASDTTCVRCAVRITRSSSEESSPHTSRTMKQNTPDVITTMETTTRPTGYTANYSGG